MSSNFQENFHKVNNIMKDQAAIRKIKHTRNQVNKTSYLPWYIETKKQECMKSKGQVSTRQTSN